MYLEFFSLFKQKSTSEILQLAIGAVALVCATQLEKPFAWIAMVAGLTMMGFLVIVAMRRPISSEMPLTASEWLREITVLLETSKEAKIYLRSFKHPEDFKDEHRKALLGLMKIFALKITRGPEHFRIVAYSDGINPNARDPKKWLIDEIVATGGKEVEASNLVNKCVTILSTEPSANTSTFYLIDNQHLAYNHREGSQYCYRIINFSRSVIPGFMAAGFERISGPGPSVP